MYNYILYANKLGIIINCKLGAVRTAVKHTNASNLYGGD